MSVDVIDNRKQIKCLKCKYFEGMEMLRRPTEPFEKSVGVVVKCKKKGIIMQPKKIGYNCEDFQSK